MQFTVRDIVQMWKVPESTVYRWVAEDKLPAEEWPPLLVRRPGTMSSLLPSAIM